MRKLIYFAKCKTYDELRKEYKRLIKIYHTDLIETGDKEIMQAINDEHDYLDELFKSDYNKDIQDERLYYDEAPSIFREILLALEKLENIDYEICGTWIWVTVLKFSDEIKNTMYDLGFFWKRKKKKYAWGKRRSYYSKELTMEEIRDIHGSIKFKTKKSKAKKDIRELEETKVIPIFN